MDHHLLLSSSLQLLLRWGVVDSGKATSGNPRLKTKRGARKILKITIGGIDVFR